MVAVGVGSEASGTQSIAIGYRNVVSGANSGAFGDPNVVSGAGSYAIGNNNTVAANNAFALGNNITIAAGSDGAVVLGKTNLDQFATGLVGTRSPYGIPRNAYNLAYVSGGSSSGSAVAVAAGLVAFALGTDTAGSGRVPAAFNHLVGYKPSKGR